jgi:hypothetical protein
MFQDSAEFSHGSESRCEASAVITLLFADAG